MSALVTTIAWTWAASEWKTAVAKDIESLKVLAAQSKEDHDVLTSLSSDVTHIKRTVDRLEQFLIVSRKEARR